MVNISDSSKQAIAAAITRAEQQTSAEIAVVMAPASDAYLGYTLLYSLLFGSAVSLGIWASDLPATFPLLLAVQFAAIALLTGFSPLRMILLRLVPERVRQLRVAQSAYSEYQALSRHVPANTPILLLYVSMAEHYAHILTCRRIREKIPDREWEALVGMFTAKVKADGLENAATDAIGRVTDQLKPHFPSGDEPNYLRNEVMLR